MIRTADQAARRARQLRFYRMVERVLRTLPPQIVPLLDDVAIVLNDEATGDYDLPDRKGEDLFGLYQGVPKTSRGSSYSLVAPDKITLFMGPLSRSCSSRSELEEQIRITILHELGHHLGFDEAGLDAIGLA